MTPSRPPELTEAVLAELKRVRDHLIERLHESEDRAATLEGALRALADACADWAGDESSDGQPLLPRRVSNALGKAVIALAPSTPKEPE